MKTTILAACAASALACSAAAQPATPPAGKIHITHEILWTMKRVGAPVVSPDGRWVVYSVVEPAYEQDKSVSDLWLVPADGQGAPRRLTNTKGPENGVSWAPDSRRIAFSAKREGDEAEQLYVLDISGGEAQRVTAVSTGARDPQWRPDGQALAFQTMVYPGALDDAANRKAAAEKKARKYNVRTYEHFPIRYWNDWLDERQPTIEVISLEPGAQPKDILSGTALAKTGGFSGRAEESGSFSLAPAWSPDGSEIVFNATTERWKAAYGHVGYKLYRIPAAGGEPKPAVDQAGGYGEAQFSPDGKHLYFTYTPQNDEIYNLARLKRVAWPAGGAAEPVAKDFDGEINRYQLTPDGKTAWLLVSEAGKENLYRVAADGGRPEKALEPAAGGYTALVIPQKAKTAELIASYSSSVSPSEVVRIDPATRKHVNLTNVDTTLAASIDWAPPEHFTFTSAGGRPIHNMIITPPNFDPAKKYPLLVFIHGGAASMNPDQISLRWDYHLLAEPGYVLLMSDYTGSTGFGEKFAQAIKLDPLKTPGLEINQAVDEALKRYPFIDGSRMCAAGASYGGHLTYWLEATTTRYRCLISHAGEVDLQTQWGTSDGIYEREVTNGGPPWEKNPVWIDQSPITYAGQWKTPILLSVGERDFRVPINNTLEAWSALQRQKVPSRLLVWPDAWHWILKPEDSRHFYDEVHAWLARYLKDQPPGTGAQAAN
jgi:dipeptidyl aminopeptidase/acylaminoacyl peptidase